MTMTDDTDHWRLAALIHREPTAEGLAMRWITSDTLERVTP